MNVLLENICSEVLDCGTADISLLDNCRYDLSAIVLDLNNSGRLTFQAIVDEVIQIGISDLSRKIEKSIDEKINDLKFLYEYAPRENDEEQEIEKKLKFIDSDEVLCSLDSEYKCEWQENIRQCLNSLNKIKKNGITDDIDYYFNYLDTHINFLRNQDTYSKFFKNEIEEVENMLGLRFENI